MSDSQGLVGCFFLSGTEKKYWTVFTCHNLAPLIMSLYCSQSTLWSDKRLLGKYLILEERTFTTAHHATDVIDTDLLGIFPLTGKMYQEETLSVSYHSVLWQQCEFCKVFHWRQGLAVQQPTMRSVLHKMRKRYHFPMNLEKCIAWVAISFISINELDMNFTLCNRSLFNTLFFFFHSSRCNSLGLMEFSKDIWITIFLSISHPFWQKLQVHLWPWEQQLRKHLWGVC